MYSMKQKRNLLKVYIDMNLAQPFTLVSSEAQLEFKWRKTDYLYWQMTVRKSWRDRLDLLYCFISLSCFSNAFRIARRVDGEAVSPPVFPQKWTLKQTCRSWRKSRAETETARFETFSSSQRAVAVRSPDGGGGFSTTDSDSFTYTHRPLGATMTPTLCVNSTQEY